jgi:hypothetical protein
MAPNSWVDHMCHGNATLTWECPTKMRCSRKTILQSTLLDVLKALWTSIIDIEC